MLKKIDYALRKIGWCGVILGLVAAVGCGWFVSHQIYKPSVVNLYGHWSPRQVIKQWVPRLDVGAYFSSILGSLDPPASENMNKASTIELVDSLMRLVNENTFHCKYYQAQNFVHSVSANLVPSLFREYGILDWRYFQCGFCHQRNFLLVQMLSKLGISSELRGINGHVIAEYVTAEETYWVDADYGVASFEKPPEEVVTEAILKAYSGVAGTTTFSGKQVPMDSILSAYLNYDNDAYYNLKVLKSLGLGQRFVLDFVGSLMIFLSSALAFTLFSLLFLKAQNSIRNMHWQQ